MNREMRRAAAKQAKRPQRQREALPIPPSFATASKANTLLDLRCREAVDAVISGQGTWDDLMGCESELIVAVRLCGMAIACDTEHQVDIAQLGPLQTELQRIALSVAGIKRRERESGRVGCTGEERQALLSLADVVDQLRQAMPRRLWLLAMRSVYSNPKMKVAHG